MDIFLANNKKVLSGENNVFYYDKKSNSIIVMQKTNKTITNENRKYIIDANNARYKANILKLVDIIDVISGTMILHSVEISYRINRVANIDHTYEIGSVIGGTDFAFNKHTMESGISYFLTFERAWHEYLFSTDQLKTEISDGDYSIKTYDSFGKSIIRTFDKNGIELFSPEELFDTIVITAKKKITNAVNYVYSFMYIS